MSDLDIAVKARFVNQMGSGARSAERDLQGVRDVAQRLGTANFGDRMRNQLRAAAEGANALHSRLQSIGNGLIQLRTGYEAIRRTLGAPVMKDADYNDVLISIAQKSDIAKDGIKGLSDEVKGMADRLKTSPLNVGMGLETLMSSLPNLDVSRKLIDPIVKVSKAYQEETSTISSAVVAMVNNLKIAPENVELALGRLSQASADGSYEIVDFARSMPSLASIMQAADQTGLSSVSRLAAALEAVRGSTGTAGETDTRIRDLLLKAQSPLVQERYAKMGVNLEGRIDKAKAEGTDIFEAIYKATTKATGGDISKLDELFTESDSMLGMQALMQNWKKYKEMRDRYEAINSPDKLNSDLALRQQGTGDSLRTFGQRWEAMQTAIGQGVNTYLKPALDVLSGMLDVFTALAEKIPAVTGAFAILAATGGAWAMGSSVGAFLKRFGGMAAPAGAATGGAGGIWRWLGAGVGFAGKFARLGGSAYLGALAGNYLGKGARELGSVIGGKYYTPADQGEADYLKQQRDGIAAQIAKIRQESKVPEMADILIRPLQDQLDQLDARLKSFDEIKVKPQIDSSSIDAAIGKVSSLGMSLRGLGGPSFAGGASPSFRNNAESPSVSRVAAIAKPGNVTNSNTYNVAGYNPGVVARRIQREQDRQLRLAMAGALHDLPSLA